MNARKLILSAALAGVIASAPDARAQWIRLQRCNGALPCAIPFGVRYNPDPLIAGQYGYVSPNGMSGRISFEPQGPVLHIDKPRVALELPDFASEAARRFLLAKPPLPPAKKTPTPSD